MKLYITDTSPYARIARIVVIEKELEKQVELIPAKTRTVGSPYYDINPSGRVPYLIRDDGVAMEDSLVITHYLDETFGDRLYDYGSGDNKWETLRLQAAANSLLEGVSVWSREIRRPPGESSPTILAHESVRSERLLKAWEKEIDHPLMNGEFNLPVMFLITALQLDLQIPDFEWRSRFPKLDQWSIQVGKRPSVEATLPPD